MAKQISNANIYNMAKDFKEYVEKNAKVPYKLTYGGVEFTTNEMQDIMTYCLLNLNSGVKADTYKWCTNANGDNIVENIYKDDYLDQAKRVRNYILTKKQVPNNVTTLKSKKRVNIDLYTYCIAKILVFNKEHGQLPNYCTYDFNVLIKPVKPSDNNCSNPYKSTPHPTRSGCDAMGQNTGYYCGVCALQHSLYKFGISVSQRQLASWAGTTTSGTSHNGIRSAVAMVNKKYGVNISVEEKNFSDLGITGLAKLICKSNVDVIVHLLYRNTWGHYESINEINVNTNMLKILNSLGDQCSGGCYCGYIEDRSLAVEKSYIGGISQKSIIILTKK